MLWVDVVLVIFLLAFAGAGGKRGFVESVGRLVGAVLGFWAARLFAAPVALLFSRLGVIHASWIQAASFIFVFFVVFGLVSWVIHLVAKILRIVTRLPIISWVDKLLGGLVGLVEGIVFLGSMLILIYTTALNPWLVRTLAASTVAHWIERIFNLSVRFVL